MNELEIIQHRQVEGLSIFFNTVEHRTAHAHPEWELIWVLDQPLHVACGQRRFVVERGQMALFGPNELHEFHKGDCGSTILCLQLSRTILPGVPAQILEANLLHDYMPPEQLRQVRESMAYIMSAYLERRPNYNLLCVGESCLLLYRLLQYLPSHALTAEETVSAHRKNARLQRLIRFVDENYMNKILLADFAAAEGCSVSYLSRFIKQTMNQTFQEYVTSVRYNCACKLIASGQKRMLDVCMESGFSDYRYFSQAFQKQCGMTPEEYSRHTRNQRPEYAAVRHSLHSVERFYDYAQSVKLLEQHCIHM